jgi:hypothetical protein
MVMLVLLMRLLTGSSATFTTNLAEMPLELMAVMVAVPAFTPVTTPLEETLATAVPFEPISPYLITYIRDDTHTKGEWRRDTNRDNALNWKNSTIHGQWH